MGKHVTKQPDGRYAIWSSIVDDFTMIAATAREVEDYLASWCGRQQIERKLSAADKDKKRLGFPDAWPEDGLRRWRDDLATLRSLRPPPEGGVKRAKKVVEEALEDPDQIAYWQDWVENIQYEEHFDEEGRVTGATWWTPEEMA